MDLLSEKPRMRTQRDRIIAWRSGWLVNEGARGRNIMLKILIDLFLKADGGARISKTKVMMIIGAVINTVIQMGWVNLTPDQVLGLNTAIATLIGIFWRDAVDSGG